MSIIEFNPDDYEIHTEHTTCQFHKDNPGVPYAGCTCTSSYSMHRKEKKDGNKKAGEANPTH